MVNFIDRIGVVINLGFCDISIFVFKSTWHYTTSPIGLKIFPMRSCIREMTHFTIYYSKKFL